MRRALGAALLLAAAAACTFSSEISVRKHELLLPLEGGLVNSYNMEEKLDQGYVPEVLSFLFSGNRKTLESTRGARVAGRALLESGDARGARPYLERAFAEEGRQSERANTAWLLSQGHYLEGSFADSALWCRRAQDFGLKVGDGWIRFLESAGGTPLYGGAAPGTRFEVPIRMTRPFLPRLSVAVNGRASDEMVFDTGASLSLITESAATRFGVAVVPDARASGYGLHRVEFSMRFGWAETLKIGDVVLTHVPFGIVPDGALSFETASMGAFTFDGVLGLHLLKEFDWRLEYARRRLFGIRIDPLATRGSRGQNLFIRRLKPMVRTSINQEPWFLFLFDTGSEPTMVTRTGLGRSKRSGGLEATYPTTLEGIGKSRVSWRKTSNVTVGVEPYMVRFRDIVVREDDASIADGVVGTSFLKSFDVEIRFRTMTVSLERPLERRLREDHAGAAAPGAP